MPIVPRIDPAPLPGVRVNGGAPAGAFGGGAGNVVAGIQPGLSAVHDEAARIAQEERNKADQIMLTAATSDLSSARNDLLFGQDGALTKRGADAFTTPETTRAAYFAQAGQIRARLTSDAQREAFDSTLDGDWSQVDEQVQSHVAAQRQAYDTQTTDALVANKQNEALRSYTDPATVAGAIEAQRAAITQFGARNGWSDAQTQDAVTKQVSATHMGVLSRMLDDGDDQRATQYYDAHKSEIAGLDQAKAERALGVGTTLGQATRISDQIIAGKYAPGLVTAGNIDLTNRPRVQNADGSISTVRSMSFERDGHEILVPTVSADGKILTHDEAIAQYDRTGQHLGIFNDAASATAYAVQLHASQAAMLDGQPTPITAAAALTQAESIENPTVREKAIDLVTSHFNELNTAQRLDRENARARVMQSLETSHGRLNEASSDWQAINGYPEGEQVLERQRQILHPPPDPGDPDKYNQFLALAATTPETRAQLLATPISDIVHDPTMNHGQITSVINLIRAERNRDVTDLQRSHTDALQAVKAAQQELDDAKSNEDDEAAAAAQSKLYAAQQRETVLRGQLTQATRAARLIAPRTATPSAGAPAAAGPSSPPRAVNDLESFGITPLAPKPLTPEMERDIVTYGAAYANYLRTMGYDVPSGPVKP